MNIKVNNKTLNAAFKNSGTKVKLNYLRTGAIYHIQKNREITLNFFFLKKTLFKALSHRDVTKFNYRPL